MQAAIEAMSQEERAIHYRHITKNREKAFAKFKTLDPDGRGYLDGEQVMELAEWVWLSFRPGQHKPDPSVKNQEALALMHHCDANQDGKLQEWEFHPLLPYMDV
jgi:Ca2+-binding EF-hand superfamily protein